MRYVGVLCTAAVVCLSFATDALATTTISGGVVINETWTSAGSPYIIQGDVTVPAGSFLHIQDGVQVRFQSGDLQGSGLDTGRIELTVDGEITVEGSAMGTTQLMADSGSGTCTWYGLIVNAGAVKAEFDHMWLQHACQGLRVHAPNNVTKIQRSEFSHTSVIAMQLYQGASLFDRVLVRNNSNDGVIITGGTTTVTNSIFRDNTDIGVIVNGNANVDLEHVLAYNNDDGVRTSTSGQVSFTNSIATDNYYGINRISGGSVSATYSNVWGNTLDFVGSITKNNNQFANPQFVNPPSDLRLQSSSVCIDTGTDLMVGHDYDNSLRPLDGDGINAAEPDMGPFEFAAMPFCGDGSLDSGEACDDGAANGTYGFCNASCSGPGPFCGDGIVNGPEECDDMNIVPGDGCDAQCMNELGGSGGMGGMTGAGGMGSGVGGAGGMSTGAGGDGPGGGMGSGAGMATGGAGTGAGTGSGAGSGSGGSTSAGRQCVHAGRAGRVRLPRRRRRRSDLQRRWRELRRLHVPRRQRERRWQRRLRRLLDQQPDSPPQPG